jgi:hypothetical protein
VFASCLCGDCEKTSMLADPLCGDSEDERLVLLAVLTVLLCVNGGRSSSTIA